MWSEANRTPHSPSGRQFSSSSPFFDRSGLELMLELLSIHVLATPSMIPLGSCPACCFSHSLCTLSLKYLVDYPCYSDPSRLLETLGGEAEGPSPP